MVDRNCPRLVRSFHPELGGAYGCEHTGRPCEVVKECEARRKSHFISRERNFHLREPVMPDREAEAIRELMNILRSDVGTLAKVLAAMIDHGFSAEETQAAVNEIAKRVHTKEDQ